MSKYTLYKAWATAGSALFAFSLLTTSIANANVNALNTFFGTSSYETIDTGSGTENTQYYKSKYTKLDNLIADTDKLIADIEREGAVLLKNDNKALPLAKGSKVSTLGIGSVRSTISASGSMAASSTTGREVDLKGGLEKAGLEVNSTLWDWYTANQDTYKTTRNGMMTPGPLLTAINEAPWETVKTAAGTSLDNYGDAAIFNVVRVSGEGNKDMNRSGCTDTPTGDALSLSNDERDVLKGLKALKDAGVIKKIIVLLNCTAIPELDFLQNDEYGVDAAIDIKAVGSTGFNGVGDLLVGNANPSGRLNDTFWYDNSKNPVLANQAGYSFENPESLALHTATEGVGGYEGHYVVYQEGIYSGYHYTETRYEDYVLGTENTGSYDYSKTVAYPFGYGLSYTDFTYSNYTVNKKGDNYVVSVDVKNTGSVEGKDVVEVYLQKPYGEYNIKNDVQAASAELVGFGKTKSLKAGESQNIKVTVSERDFAAYDANKANTYVLTPGKYYLSIGNGAHEAVNNILANKGVTISSSSNRMDAEGNKDLAKVALTQSALDTKKYSTSKETGQEITNLFDFADLNKNEETKSHGCKYVSRSNWDGTVVLDPLNDNPNYTKVYLTAKLLAEMRAGWDGSTLKTDEVKYPTYGADSNLNLVDMMKDESGEDIPYDADIWNTFMDQLTWDDTVSLLSEGMRMTAGLTSINKPATKDHNGPCGVTETFASGTNGLAFKNGESETARSSTFPSMGLLSCSYDEELMTKVGENFGENCLWAGYSGLYGPGMNIHRSQYSSRNSEYYSEDGFLTGKTAAIQSKAIQSKGAYVYIKHFVLNDQETNRYGLSTWLNEQSFREIYLKAFQIAIEEGDAHAMMTSYNRVGTRNAATLSPLMNDWLRGEEGFDGFAVTDMYILKTMYSLTFYMGMVTMPTAVLCGNDLVDGSISAAKQFDPYKTGYGELANAMRESAKRILYTTVHSNAMNGLSSTTEIRKVMTPWQKGLIAADSVFAAIAVSGLIFLGFAFYKKNIKKKEKEVK